ncbi:MAG: endonuclease III domain-containing protein, partial [Planctomycetia bacterium]
MNSSTDRRGEGAENRSRPSRESAVPRPGRESVTARRRRAGEIAERLAAAHPRAECSLAFDNPFQLLVATILSAQCTDKRVNMVTGDLFRRWPTPAALAAARPRDLEGAIR